MRSVDLVLTIASFDYPLPETHAFRSWLLVASDLNICSDIHVVSVPSVIPDITLGQVIGLLRIELDFQVHREVHHILLIEVVTRAVSAPPTLVQSELTRLSCGRADPLGFSMADHRVTVHGHGLEHVVKVHQVDAGELLVDACKHATIHSDFSAMERIL